MTGALVTLTLANHNYPLKDLVAAVTDAAAIKAEQVSNGAFNDNSAWTFGSGWTHDNTDKEADHSSGTEALQQNVGVVVGELYRLVFTVKNRSAGSVTPTLGGVACNTVASNATSTQYVVASTTGNLIFTPTNDFDGSIDDVSVKRIKATAAAPYRGVLITMQAPSGNAAAVLVGDASLSTTRYGVSMSHTDQRPHPFSSVRPIGLGNFYARSANASQQLAICVIGT